MRQYLQVFILYICVTLNLKCRSPTYYHKHVNYINPIQYHRDDWLWNIIHHAFATYQPEQKLRRSSNWLVLYKFAHIFVNINLKHIFKTEHIFLKHGHFCDCPFWIQSIMCRYKKFMDYTLYRHHGTINHLANVTLWTTQVMNLTM